MNVYLMRNGEAEPEREGLDDRDRKLTAEGAQAVGACMPGLKKLVGQVDFILSSPLRRAVETEDVIASHFKCKGFIDLVEALASGGNETRVTKDINKLIGKENVVVVGHEPHLSALAKFICGDSLGEPLNLKKGGVAKIYIPGFPGPGEGSLRWTMTPEEMQRLANN